MLETWHDDVTILQQRIRQLDKPERAVAFYGSSSIRLWSSMSDDLQPLQTINLGFGGSTYEDCRYFFPNLFARFQPSTLVLYSGDNDLANGKSATEIMMDFEAIVQSARKLIPRTAIAVISIKPSPLRIGLIHEIQEINAYIRTYIESFGGIYIDIFTPMLAQAKQSFDALFAEDRLHLSPAGYRLWTSIVKLHLLGSKLA